jgi:hypothetical protein
MVEGLPTLLRVMMSKTKKLTPIARAGQNRTDFGQRVLIKELF